MEASALRQLGVQPSGYAMLHTPAGASRYPIFPARLDFPGLGMHVEFSEISGVDLTGMALPDGRRVVCLIGRDILRRGLLVYNGAAGMWTIAL